MKKLLFILLVPLFLCANSIGLKEIQVLMFEDAFENIVKIPKGTKKLVVSFDKKGNALMSEYLNAKPKNFLSKHDAIYIGDIHKMPSIITYMFARPKMKEYNFTIYLYNDEGLNEYIPYKQNHVTVVDFDSEGKVKNQIFIKEAKLAFE